jgi:hypothetical protein
MVYVRWQWVFKKQEVCHVYGTENKGSFDRMVEFNNRGSLKKYFLELLLI